MALGPSLDLGVMLLPAVSKMSPRRGRISGNWWEQLWAREEWDVQTTDGRLYRIFLDNNKWFVDGAYD